MPERLHFIPNASAAGAAEMVFPDDETAMFTDALSEGPVPPLSSAPDIRTWMTRRIDFWQDLPNSPDRDHYLAPLDEFLESFDRCNRYDEIVVWSSEVLAEGLFACWAVCALSRRGVDASRLELAHPAPFPHASPPVNLGGTSPEQMHETTPRPWTDRQFQLAREAWHHFTAPSPELLAQFVEKVPQRGFLSGLPSIRGRFPSAQTGLDVWERALLERMSAHDEPTAHTVAHVFTDAAETHDHTGDILLFRRLLELSDPEHPRPLLERSGPGTDIRNTDFELTDLGEAVLAGEENRVDVLGLDRWIGGVHLCSEDEEVWWRVGDTIQSERPTA